jgi:hypothetical protein
VIETVEQKIERLDRWLVGDIDDHGVPKNGLLKKVDNLAADSRTAARKQNIIIGFVVVAFITDIPRALEQASQVLKALEVLGGPK